MKKTNLVILPVFAALLLAGCTTRKPSKKKTSNAQVTSTTKTPGGTSTTQPGGTSTTKPGGTSVAPSQTTVIPPVSQPDVPTGALLIDYEALKSNFDEKYVYPKADYSFTVGGVSFNATAGVGHKTSNTSGGNYYYEQKALQFRKANHESGGGVITVAQETTYSKVTVNWLATYATEASQYHPVVKVGSSAAAITTNVPCNEGTEVSGTSTGGVENVNNADRDVYRYVTTYTISGNSYFAIMSQNNAMYITSIIVE